MGGEVAGGGEQLAAEWNFNAFKVLVLGCNGKRWVRLLLEGKGWARVALELAWKRWLDDTAVRQRMAVAGGGGAVICPRKRTSSIGSAGLKKPSWPRGQLGQGVVADLTFYAFVNKKSKIERL
jgi:hypothetical protein